MLYCQWLDTFWFAKYINCPVYNVLLKHKVFSVRSGVMEANYDNFNDPLIWDTYEDVLADLKILYGGYKCAATSTTHMMILERMT